MTSPVKRILKIAMIPLLLNCFLSFTDCFADFKIEDTLRVKKGHFHPHVYNMKISPKKKFLWFRLYKNASGTIKTMIQREAPDYIAIKNPIVPKQYQGYFKFAFVRNPWDRAVSFYFHKIMTRKSNEFKQCHGRSFEYFINYLNHINVRNGNPHIRLQTQAFPVDQCDFIGKVDNMDEDLQYVCNKLGIKKGVLGHKNHTEHKHYSCYYTPKTRKIIADLYREDIDTFGFTFDNKKIFHKRFRINF